MSGIKLLHVPYKGGGDSLSDIIAGRVDLKFGSAPEAIPPVKAGRLKAIAISLDARWPDLPNVPTFGESGWPQYKTGTWDGLCAPAKTPRAIINQIYGETRDALVHPATFANGFGCWERVRAGAHRRNFQRSSAAKRSGGPVWLDKPVLSLSKWSVPPLVDTACRKMR